MGGASRFIMLLATTPVPHLQPRTCLLRLARHSRFSLSPSPLSLSLHLLSTSRGFLPQLAVPAKSSRLIHIRSSAVRDEDSSGQLTNSFVSHPWPEWSKFIDVLSSAGHFNHQAQGILAEDAFVAYADLPMEFVRIVSASFDYSRRQPHLLRSLSRRDMGVVVRNGTPFLFRSSLESSRRMKSFLGITGSPGLEHEEAHMIDLMKYLLSYASKPTVSSNGIHMNIGDIESSVRNLLNELTRLSSGMEASQFSSIMQHQVPDSYAQQQRSLGPKIEMKRGDWICSRCSFMNFARNNKCLECEEARPMRQLTGREWACPQCDFYNYGRNVTCLRCECKRPGELPSRSTNEYPKGSTSKSQNSTFVPLPTNMFAQRSSKLAEDGEKTTTEVLGSVDGYAAPRPLNEEKNFLDKEKEGDKSESWLKKLEDLHDVTTTDSTDAIPEEDFPDIMPMRKGENRFVVSKRKDRSLVTPMYKRKMAAEQSSGSSFVPFVPFPPDYFAKDKKKTLPEEGDTHQTPPSPTLDKNKEIKSGGSTTSVSGRDHPTEQTTESPLNTTMRSEGTMFKHNEPSERRKSLEGSAVQESYDPLDMSEEAKAQRWFRRVAQIKDISELSEIPDEDFPSIMPMRKGVNRFVVSKRKTPLERRLTSSQYRKNLPTVISSPSDHVITKKEENNGS